MRNSPFLKILLPLCLLLLLRPLPVSTGVERGLEQARTAEEEGYPQAAADGYREALLREPWRTGLWERLGRAEYSAGNPEQALQDLQSGLEQDALSAEGRFLMAEIWLQAGDERAAEALLQELIAQEDGSASGIALLARVYERLVKIYSSDPSAVVAALKDWQASPARSARSAYLLGLHLSVTAPAQAEQPLIEAARADLSYSAAVQVLRRGLAQNMNTDDPASGWLMVGRALGSLEEWPLAEQAFRQAVELAPEYAEAWAFLSEARVHTGGSGQPEMQRALSLAPRSNLVNALNALSLRRQARYAEALDALTAAASLEPEEPFWLLEIAATQVAMGDLISARDYYQQAVELAPENSTYWQAQARFSVDYHVDMRGLGLPAARQAVMLSPEDPSALDVMGWTLANLDDSLTGERFLQQALEIDPAHAAANLHLAQIYLSRRQSSEAYFYLKQAASGGTAQDAALAEAETARRLLQRYFGEDS